MEVHELRTYKGKDLAERDAVCHGVTIKAISRPFMGECFTFTVWPGFRWYYQSAHGSWQFDPSRPGNGPEGAGTFNDSAWVSWAPEGSLVGKDATNHVAFKYEAGGSWWNNRNYDLTFTLIINDYSYLDNKGVMSVVITC